jgi:hypothetical protein
VIERDTANPPQRTDAWTVREHGNVRCWPDRGSVTPAERFDHSSETSRTSEHYQADGRGGEKCLHRRRWGGTP